MAKGPDIEIPELLEHASAVARRAGDHTLNFFNQGVEVERKADDSPVTVADREAEQLMRRQIEAVYPDHGIIGEEFGRVREKSPVQWILDPIDGTKSFIHGVPLYTTLVGIMVNNEPVVGVIYAPALDELCEAVKGEGTYLNGSTCRVRSCDRLEEATFLTTDLHTAHEEGYGNFMDDMVEKTRLHRTWGDAYGHMLVATGRADIMFDPILNLWDAAPLLTAVTEAGGSYFDVQGQASIETGSAFSCNKTLRSDVLAILDSHKQQ